MSKQTDDYKRRLTTQEIEVKAPPDGLNCPECGHWPLVRSYYDGGDPPVYDPCVYFECSSCGYSSAENEG